MNCAIHYNLLINRSIERELSGYTERHHVVPRCMGGSDDKTNIVQLTPEEHFVAHVLLVKMYPDHIGLICAVNKMCRGHNGHRKRKLYGWLKRRFSEVQSAKQTGSGNSQYGAKWATDGMNNVKLKPGEELPTGFSYGRITVGHSSLKGRKLSDEHRLKLVKASTGRIYSDETRRKLKESATRRIHTPETRLKMSTSRKTYLLSKH